jgi:predicted PurR-regulated permease PerM
LDRPAETLTPGAPALDPDAVAARPSVVGPEPVLPVPDPARLERRAFLAAISAIVLAFAWFILRPLAAPLVLALLTAVIAYPLHARVERFFRGRSVLAALTTLLLLTILFWGPAAGLSTLFFLQAREAAAQMLGQEENRGRLVAAVEHGVDWLSQLAQATVGDAVDVARMSRQAVEKMATALYERIPDLFGQAGRVAFGALLLYLVVFILLVRGRELLDLFVELSPISAEHTRRNRDRQQGTIKGVFLGALATALIQGMIASFGFWLAGFPSHLIWGALLAGAGLIPVFGTGLIWVPATLYLSMIGRTGDALWMLGVGAVVSSVDNLVKPLLIHDRAEVHPPLVFIGLFGGLASFGAMGLLYGPLLVACLTEMVRIYRDDFKPRPRLLRP